MRMFNDDPETDAVIMVGEIGGDDEETCARWIKDHMKKPVVGFIAGVTAPPGKRMGHAGAIISGGKGTANEKLAVMEECGIKVTRNPAEMAALLKSVLHDALTWRWAPVPVERRPHRVRDRSMAMHIIEHERRHVRRAARDRAARSRGDVHAAESLPAVQNRRAVEQLHRAG